MTGAAEENPKERLDRELIELLNEIRVALPGVQVLFAFLLAVPFQQGFQDVTSLQRAAYFGALCFALLASALLVAPSAFHRFNFRRRNKKRLVFVSNWLVLGGMSALAVAMTCSLLLVTDVLFRGWVAALVAGGAGLMFTVMWFAFPIHERRRASVRDGLGEDDGP